MRRRLATLQVRPADSPRRLLGRIRTVTNRRSSTLPLPVFCNPWAAGLHKPAGPVYMQNNNEFHWSCFVRTPVLFLFGCGWSVVSFVLAITGRTYDKQRSNVLAGTHGRGCTLTGQAGATGPCQPCRGYAVRAQRRRSRGGQACTGRAAASTATLRYFRPQRSDRAGSSWLRRVLGFSTAVLITPAQRS